MIPTNPLKWPSTTTCVCFHWLLFTSLSPSHIPHKMPTCYFVIHNKIHSIVHSSFFRLLLLRHILGTAKGHESSLVTSGSANESVAEGWPTESITILCSGLTLTGKYKQNILQEILELCIQIKYPDKEKDASTQPSMSSIQCQMQTNIFHHAHLFSHPRILLLSITTIGFTHRSLGTVVSEE